jgi:hypothetical protein
MEVSFIGGENGVPGETHLAWTRFELPTLVVIEDDCIGSY